MTWSEIKKQADDAGIPDDAPVFMRPYNGGDIKRPILRMKIECLHEVLIDPHTGDKTVVCPPWIEFQFSRRNGRDGERRVSQRLGR